MILLLSYLLGTIPFGLLLSKLAGYGDIRKVGSGNIGATNVLRTGNKKLALLTLLLDGAKGAVAVLIAQSLYPENSPVPALAGFCALLGHTFPIWLKFKGGKGVATGLGIWLALNPPLGIIACAVWAVVFYKTRYSSLSALTAFAVLPLCAFIFASLAQGLLACAISGLIVWRHKDNIKRLLTRTEPKFGKK
jgi:glycerol-3-phosphate acyltransferase PlsY